MTMPTAGTTPLAALRAAGERDAFQADHEYAHEHFDEWLAKYPDQWIVVKDLELVLVTPNEDDVRRALEEYGTNVVVDFLYPRGLQRVSAVHD